MNETERAVLLDRLDPRVGAWFALWFLPDAIEAASLGHPYRRIPYGAGALAALNAAGRPYRYTMRRKIRQLARSL